MNQTSKNPLLRAMSIAERDRISPIACLRRDTGELIWLVQSRSDPSHHYLLTGSEQTIQCPCPQAQHRGICAHAAAVRLDMQRRTSPEARGVSTEQTKPTVSPPSPPERGSASPSDQKRRRRADAERRERALLWTDDRPFSVWKS